jgi:hypothetical protein
VAAARIAHHCGNLPLALRLVAELATRTPHRSLPVLAADLADPRRRLDVLDALGDERSAVRSVLSWSYRRLPIAATHLLHQLARHAEGPVDANQAAELAGTSAAEADRHLSLLAGEHLLVPVGGERFDIGELIRAYAAEQRPATGNRQPLAHPGFVSVDSKRSPTRGPVRPPRRRNSFSGGMH